MKKLLLIGLFLPTALFLWSQKIDYLINPAEVKRVMGVLASDEMQGRRIYTEGIEKAADFIESEFKEIGLRTFDAGDKYRQSFMMIRPDFVSASALLDGVALESDKLMIITCQPHLVVDKSSEYEIEQIGPGQNLFRAASRFLPPKKNTVVIVDESYAADFGRLAAFRRSIPKTDKSIIFLLTNKSPENFAIEARHGIREQRLSNIIGVLPGKSKKNELVIFSAHYDHLGTGQPRQGDSIFNGANDNASGTTAVIMLARYFREMKNNERTLVFAAFTAEEAGGFGSNYFSRQLDPGKVAAMFNIEMIGTESKWGKQSAYITGFDKTDMGSLLQKNLEGSGFRYHPDPYTDKQLFYRSDNATLARLGVPAHTISTSRMDLDTNYHKVTDHVETLDLENMTQIIKSIALSAKGIVEARETPSRVKPEELRQ